MTIRMRTASEANRSQHAERPAEIKAYEDLWESTFRPLFPDEAFNFKVRIRGGSEVRYINFDHAATTMPFKEVRSYIDRWFNTYGSVHRGAGYKSVATTAAYDATRERVRRFVKASPSNYVLYTKNTTESINQAATLWATHPGRVLVSDIEHSSNLLPWVKHGEVVQYKTNRDGTVDLPEIERILEQHAFGPKEKRIKLVTFTACSNITGYSPPIYKIAELAHKYGAQAFADLCQFIPHEPVDMLPDDHPAHLDFLGFSGHKMYAPYGIGVLVGPKRFFDEQPPYHVGGGNLPYITHDLVMKRFYTERAHDPGSPNAAGPVALAKAMDILDAVGRDTIVKYEHALVHYAYDQMSAIPGMKIYAKKEHLGHVIPFDVEGFDPRLIAVVLSLEYGIGARAGAFCTYEYIRKLKGITPEQDAQIAAEVDQGIVRNIPQVARASFSICNPIIDIDVLVEALEEMASRGVEHYLSQYVQEENGTWALSTRQEGKVERKSRRYSVIVDVQTKDIPSAFTAEVIEDLSAEGAFIVTDHLLPVDTVATLRLKPIGRKPLDLKAQVRWVRTEGENQGVGVRFIFDTPEAEKQILELVEQVRVHHKNEMAMAGIA